MAATSTGTPSDQELASNPYNHFKTLAVALCNPDAKEEPKQDFETNEDSLETQES